MSQSEILVIFSAFLLFLSTAIQLFLSPFTKVEESFNLHALHDFIHQPSYPAIARFGDHVSFPGSVPRTFIGPLILGSIVSPILALVRLLGFLHSKFAEQLICRALLGLINASALVYFGLSARFVFGNLAAAGMLLLSAAQFHLPFYATRTLPNMFAFPLVQIALGQYMVTMRRTHAATASRRRRTLRACSLLTISAIVFRLELIGLLAPITLLSLLSRRVTFWELVGRGFLATFAALEMTVPIDSYFWQKLIWPEGASVIYNVIEGNAKNWGIMPWHFYLTSSLPKLLGVTYPLAVLGFVLNRKMFLLGLSTAVFIGAMCGLGHKETRFIIYIVPIWNLSTAICLHRLSSLLWNSGAVRVVLVTAVGLATVLSTVFSTYLSMHNYPGGTALLRLHGALEPVVDGVGRTVRVHLDDLVCQSGGSRFLQLRDADGQAVYPTGGPDWTYDKLANLSQANTSQLFDVIISERAQIDGFEPLERISAFNRLVSRKKADGIDESFPKRVGKVVKKLKGTSGGDNIKSPRAMWQLAVKELLPLKILFDPQRVTIFINQQNQNPSRINHT